MPKTVDTRRHCKVELRACNNLPQPHPCISVFWGCGRYMMLAVPFCVYRLWHGVIPSCLIYFFSYNYTWRHPYILLHFNDFYTCEKGNPRGTEQLKHTIHQTRQRDHNLEMLACHEIRTSANINFIDTKAITTAINCVCCTCFT